MTDAPQHAPSEEAQELARKAARIARAEGHDWKTLPKESRLEYRRRVQQAEGSADAS